VLLARLSVVASHLCDADLLQESISIRHYFVSNQHPAPAIEMLAGCSTMKTIMDESGRTWP
jgi:hypothetical protein